MTPVAQTAPVRVLILTASVGEGHDLPARTLAAQLRAERPGIEVITEDAIAAMGSVVGAMSERAPRVLYFRMEWAWDIGYWLSTSVPPIRGLVRRLLGRVGSRGLVDLVRRRRPDVIVSTWPGSTEALGWLRRTDRLAVPVCAAVTDLAGLRYWAAPGVDLHLVTHPESIPEVRRIAGPGAAVQPAHGLTAPQFLTPRDPAEARRELGLAAEGKLVLVSGGGWGVGDTEGAVEIALGLEEVDQVVCLCGRNEALAARLRAAHAGDPRVRVEGFTDRMGDWLAAGDALIHSTAGLTVLEAHIRGCPTISYGWGRGHIRPNNRAFRRFGLAEVVTRRERLGDALGRALAERRPQDLSLAALPSAASLVLALAGHPAPQGTPLARSPT
jgi:processive 1,2-diacylglycerol beta-glucosyltransferase